MWFSWHEFYRRIARMAILAYLGLPRVVPLHTGLRILALAACPKAARTGEWFV